MRKYTQKELKEYVKGGFAIDITYAEHKEIQTIKANEKWFTEIGYSQGVYGCNGCLLQGHESGKLYAITKRSSAIYSI